MAKEKESKSTVCDSCKLDARKMALSIADENSESLRGLGMYGKDELLKDADDIYKWPMQDSE